MFTHTHKIAMSEIYVCNHLFNFSYVVLLHLCVYMCMLGPKKIRPMELLVARILGSCQKHNSGLGNEPCFNCSAMTLDLEMSGNRKGLIQEKNSSHVNNLTKTLDIIIVFSFKKKNLVSFLLHRSLEGSKLFTMFTRV